MRKKNDMDETEEPGFQLQALEVREPGANFDPTKTPETGEEYLTHMLYERKRCPAVVTKRPTKQSSDKCHSNFEAMQSPALPTKKSLLPTPEWRQIQVESFKETRARVDLVLKELQVQKYDQSLEPPLCSDENKWLQFCRTEDPKLSTLLRLSQLQLEKLLDMQSKWLQQPHQHQPPDKHQPDEPSTSSTTANIAFGDESSIDLRTRDAWLGRWIYATLVCLHLPLEPYVFSTLRTMARSCVKLRDQLPPDEVARAAPYNIIITIVATVFAQSDFMDYL